LKEEEKRRKVRSEPEIKGKEGGKRKYVYYFNTLHIFLQQDCKK